MLNQDTWRDYWTLSNFCHFRDIFPEYHMFRKIYVDVRKRFREFSLEQQLILVDYDNEFGKRVAKQTPEEQIMLFKLSKATSTIEKELDSNFYQLMSRGIHLIEPVVCKTEMVGAKQDHLGTHQNEAYNNAQREYQLICSQADPGWTNFVEDSLDKKLKTIFD
jgi:hypothetical protein